MRKELQELWDGISGNDMELNIVGRVFFFAMSMMVLIVVPFGLLIGFMVTKSTTKEKRKP